MRENTLSPRKVFFATYTPNGSPLGGRRREKWIEPYSRPAGRELCEAFLTGWNPRNRNGYGDLFMGESSVLPLTLPQTAFYTSVGSMTYPAGEAIPRRGIVVLWGRYPRCARLS